MDFTKMVFSTSLEFVKHRYKNKKMGVKIKIYALVKFFLDFIKWYA